MKQMISRREFVIQATTATAAASAYNPFAAYALQPNALILNSSLSPVKSGSLFNVARNRAVYQSSAVDDDHTGHLVTDGSGSTYWESRAAGEQWISVDLGEVVPINRLTIHWGKSYARSYRIEVSSEGTDDTP